MARNSLERSGWIGFAVLGLVMGGLFAAEGRFVPAALAAVALLGLAWWMAPWRGGRSPRHAALQELPAEDRAVVIYWRPGCAFCSRLRAALGDAGKQSTWVNIWQDAEAAEYVRSVNGGDETVPTVVLDGQPVTNPDPRRVREHLR